MSGTAEYVPRRAGVATRTGQLATVHDPAAAGIAPEPIRCSHRDDPDRVPTGARNPAGPAGQTEEGRSHEHTARLVPRRSTAGRRRLPSGREEG
ncbi:hypothetical protein FAGKG844_460036 [Frankia sp. AgKG'84/4]